MTFTLKPANVINVNKSGTPHGAGLNFLIGSNRHLEVVVRLLQSEEDWKIYTRNRNWPVYPGQEVNIVCVESNVVACVDIATRNYYYTSENYSVRLGLGIAFYWVLVVGVLGGFLVNYFQHDPSVIEMLTPLACAWFLYTIQQWTHHFRFKKQLDKFLEE